jgi:hypothetical protein
MEDFGHADVRVAGPSTLISMGQPRGDRDGGQRGNNLGRMQY